MEAQTVGKYRIHTTDQFWKISGANNFSVTNSETGQKLAVLILFKNEFQFPYFLEEQSRILTKIKSPFLSQFVDVISIQMKIYIFYKPLPESINKYILKNQNPIPEAQAIKITSQILKGFIQLNRYGIPYDRINSNSIFIKEGNVKMIHYGVQFIRQGSASNDVLDLYDPSLFQYEKDFQHVSSIWSIGVIMYYLLTKSNFYTELFKITRSQENGLIKIPKVIFPAQLKISEDYQNIVERCLRINFNERISWHELITHNLFKGLIQQEIQSDEQTKYNFTLTDIRRNVYRRNINIQKYLEKFPQFLNKQTIFYILKTLNKGLSNKEVKNVVKIMTENNFSVITKEAFIRMLQKNHIITSGSRGYQSKLNRTRRALYEADQNYEQKLKNVIPILQEKMKSKSKKKKYIERLQFQIIMIQNKVLCHSQILMYKLYGTSRIQLIKLIEVLYQIIELPFVNKKIRMDHCLLIEQNYYTQSQATAFMIENYIKECDEKLGCMTLKLLSEQIVESQEYKKIQNIYCQD